VRLPAFLLFIWLATSFEKAQGSNSASPEYAPAQVLNALRLLREQRGATNPPKLSVCLQNSSEGRWSDLQAHFYCWLKPDQRACFTGAVDGELKDYPELKGNYDLAFDHCQKAKGRAYGINFDRPMARFTLEQGEVFKNVLYRQPMFANDDQQKILEDFYSGRVPERKAFPIELTPASIKTAKIVAAAGKTVPASVDTAAVKPVPIVMAAAPGMANPDMAELENAVPFEGYPRSCRVKSNNARTRQQPDANSPIVATLDQTPIKVTGPAKASSGSDNKPWYPVEFHQTGQLINAWLTVSLVDCSK
jgi:hypothetical protein